MKAIPNFEGIYFASKCGKILRNGKELKQKNLNSGYKYVALSKEGKVTYHSVHRLVWSAFNGEILKGLEVNHLNGIKTDNRLENLEACTRSNNISHSYAMRGMARGKDNKPLLTKEEIAAIRFFYVGGRKNGSVKILSKVFNRTKDNIRRIALGKAAYSNQC